MVASISKYLKYSQIQWICQYDYMHFAYFPVCGKAFNYASVLQESIQAIRTALVTNVTDLASFFWDHLKKDLRIIGKCLPRGENEVIIVLHRIVQHVAGMQPTIGRFTMGLMCILEMLFYCTVLYVC